MLRAIFACTGQESHPPGKLHPSVQSTAVAQWPQQSLWGPLVAGRALALGANKVLEVKLLQILAPEFSGLPPNDLSHPEMRK